MSADHCIVQTHTPRYQTLKVHLDEIEKVFMVKHTIKIGKDMFFCSKHMAGRGETERLVWKILAPLTYQWDY